MEGKKVLVTGGAGYIGSHAAISLLDAGYDVVVLDDFSTGKKAAIPHGCDAVEGNVGDVDLLMELMASNDFCGVLHFAGSVVVEESVVDPLKYYLNNVANTMTLIEACTRRQIHRFIFSSSAAVYGNPVAIPVPESGNRNPINPYGWSKFMAEQALFDTAKAVPKFRFGVLRYFNVAGADPYLRSGQSGSASTHLIKVACEVAVGLRDGVEIFGNDYPTRDGTCVRDFIHVEDLANIHVALLQGISDQSRSFVLNCGLGRGYSVQEVLDSVSRMAGIELKTTVSARRAGDAAELIADVRKLERALSWQPKYDDLDLIIGTALAWERHLMEAGTD